MIDNDHCEVVLVRDGTNDDEWLDARQTGITGSDALAAMGMDPRKHRATLWLEKVQGGRSVEETEPMVMGRILEPAVKEAFAWKSGLEVIDSDVLLRSVARPWMLATPDGYVRDATGQLGVFEAKTTTVWLEDQWSNGQIPERAAAQTMHYLAVTGLAFGFVAVLINNSVQYRYVERDEELIARIIELEEEFWGYVTRNEMPPMTAGPDRADVIGALWPTHLAGKTVELDDRSVLDAYRQAAQQESHWEKRRKELGEELRLLAADAEVINYLGEPVATLRASEVRRIDSDALRRLHPDIANEVTKTTTQRVLRLTKTKGDNQ